MRVESLLQAIYLDPAHPASFSSPRELFLAARQHNKAIKMEHVREWLATRNSYTLHKPILIHFPRRKIIVSGVGFQFQADLADLTSLKEANDDTRYLLTVIDCFSRKATAVPMKSKDQKTSISAFKKAFKDLGFPKRLQTDKGSEFIAGSVKEYFKENGIHHFTTKDHRIKASIVERFNRTLKGRMVKYLVENQTLRYVDALPLFLDAYNNRVHSTTGFAPNEVNEFNQEEVFEAQYGDYLKKPIRKPRHKLGDQVRLAIEITPYGKVFKRGHHRNFSVDIYTVVEVHQSRPPSYRVKNNNKQTAESALVYENQLTPAKPIKKIGRMIGTHPFFGVPPQYYQDILNKMETKRLQSSKKLLKDIEKYSPRQRHGFSRKSNK